MIWAIDYEELNVGSYTMHLDFDGNTIEKHRRNGPYNLKNIVLSRGSSDIDIGLTIADIAIDAYTTSTYNYMNFVGPSDEW